MGKIIDVNLCTAKTAKTLMDCQSLSYAWDQLALGKCFVNVISRNFSHRFSLKIER